MDTSFNITCSLECNDEIIFQTIKIKHKLNPYSYAINANEDSAKYKGFCKLHGLLLVQTMNSVDVF